MKTARAFSAATNSLTLPPLSGKKLYFALMILCVEASSLQALTGGNLYRVLMDRKGKPYRLRYICTLGDKDPEEHLLKKLDYTHPAVLDKGQGRLIYNRSENLIPILCFHRIGEGQNYELSLKRTKKLFSFLVRNHFYPLNDGQFGRGELYDVPSGMKPIVMGADDGGRTNIVWDEGTLAQYNRGGEAPRFFGLAPDCFASLFAQYFSPVDGHYSFTFYLSFDAIPFRQLGRTPNRGFPYENMPVVGDKIRYAYDHYHLGYHGLTHTFREELTTEQFVDEIMESSRIISDYLGKPVLLPTLAYPYGSGHIGPEVEAGYESFIKEGLFPSIAFDLDGAFSLPPWHREFRALDISRFNVDNKNYNHLMKKLKSRGLFKSRRVFLIQARTKKFDLTDYGINASFRDRIYVFIP